MRYTLAFVCLLPFALQPKNRRQFLKLSGRDWSGLLALGVLFYALTQGAQFLGLAYLPAATTSLLLNFTSIIVAFMGIAFLAEVPTWLQWGGMGLFIAGILVYFYPIHIPQAQALGFIASGVGVLANAASSILGRGINRERRISPLIVTTASMGFGALLLLITGLGLEGLPGSQPDKLGYHRLAGAGEYCLCFYALESHFAHAQRHGIQHHQRHHADPDRHIGLDFLGRSLDASGNPGDAARRARRPGCTATPQANPA